MGEYFILISSIGPERMCTYEELEACFLFYRKSPHPTLSLRKFIRMFFASFYLFIYFCLQVMHLQASLPPIARVQGPVALFNTTLQFHTPVSCPIIWITIFLTRACFHRKITQGKALYLNIISLTFCLYCRSYILCIYLCCDKIILFDVWKSC